MPKTRKTEEELEEDLETEAEAAGAEDPAAEEADEEDEAEIDLSGPATAAAKASALRLIELLVEKKVLALHKKPGPALIEGVARVLESPLPVRLRATKLSDAIVDSEDVDELFVDDETMVELLKRW